MDTIHALQEALGGRYVIEQELGRGGMGVVYLAWETALERSVALKILPPAYATRRRRERFLREARIAARLEHDHIVPIYAVDEAGPFVYFTMQYVRGRTLAQRILDEGALPVDEATRILHDVARAVHYAHRRGVVHRDLKPQNILLERETGRAYVTDFGIARVATEAAPPGAGRTFGTYAYVSPEQAAGRPADSRSDVYSLGVVGYVMAAGRPLFSGTPREILEQHATRPAPALDVVGRHLDVTLSRAVGRCLAKDPAARFQTADELARFLSLAPELSSELPPRLGEFVSALRLQAKAVPVAVLAAAVAAGVGWSSLQEGALGTAAGALGFLALLLLSPVLAALPPTRRLLKQGYGRADIVHALHMDLDRQRERLAARGGGASDAADKVWRGIVALGVGLFGFGAAGALFAGAYLPERVVILSIAIGMLTTLLGGVTLVYRERRRNWLWGTRWLRFWHSRWGGWLARLAGIGLGAVPAEPELPAAEPGEALPAAAGALHDVVERSEWCVRRVRERLAEWTAERTRERREPTSEELAREETLERQVAALEQLLAAIVEASVSGASDDSLAADLEAAREVCEMVEALIEVGEGR